MSYNKYRSHLQKIADIGYSQAVLQWDQECYMPTRGAHYRAQQLSTLAGIAHELATEASFGKLLSELADDSTLTEKEFRNVRYSLKEYKKHLKYSTEFVQRMSLKISEAFQAWQQAKKEDNWGLFEPSLTELVELKREECELLGYADHPYDALLDEYEPGSTTAALTALFDEVREQLVQFVQQIRKADQLSNECLFQQFDKDDQWKLGIDLLREMGYDFEGGRQDISTHPFTTNFSAEDVRVTTRINEKNLAEMIWSCIHEGGHALYEQGLPSEDYGLPSGAYLALGIHESQSRLWENNVGRSLGYWKHNYPKLQELFTDQLVNVSVEAFYAAMNKVEPSLIRTAADELTYHFHVLIRFEIEKGLIEGSISVADLPQQWNAKYKEYLGVDVPSDAEGVLQDIHWSHGSFGYFPTYSLGSFYAAQFYTKAKEQIKNLEEEIESGNNKPLLTWLRENIHKHGKTYTADELCKRITGERLNFKYFMDYARDKYSNLYKLTLESPTPI